MLHRGRSWPRLISVVNLGSRGKHNRSRRGHVFNRVIYVNFEIKVLCLSEYRFYRKFFKYFRCRYYCKWFLHYYGLLSSWMWLAINMQSEILRYVNWHTRQCSESVNVFNRRLVSIFVWLVVISSVNSSLLSSIYLIKVFFRCCFRITRCFMLRSQDELNSWDALWEM